MASRYRPSPPPYGRRIVVPERSSTGTFGPPTNTTYYDPYYTRERREPYRSPRTSGERVVPVSTETYRNGSLVSSSRPGATYDQYNDPRRASLPVPEPGQRRPSHQPSSSTSAASGRGGPAVIHQNFDRTADVGSRHTDRYDHGGYYITPASSSGRRQQKKTYSIDDSKRARPVEDGDREYRSREPRYHLTGPSKRSTDDDDDDYLGYEYATPRDVFENTEPRRQTRRRGSVDAPSRDRPTASTESYAPTKTWQREMGPPSTTKALEKVNNGGGVARRDSMREQVRSPPRNRDRRSFESHSEDDDYYVAPRQRRDRIEPAYYERDDPYSPTRSKFDQGRQPLAASRKFEDTDVANRGFGIRPASIDPPHSRDESIDSKGRYTTEQRQPPPPPPPDYPTESRREDRKWETDLRQRDRGPEVDREADAPRRKERERDRHHAEDPRSHEKYGEDEGEPSRRDRPREDRRKDDGSAASVALPVAAAGTAAYAVGELARGKGQEGNRNRAVEAKEKEPTTQEERRIESPDETLTRERHYVTKDEQREVGPVPGDDASAPMDPDEEFRLRVQEEANRAKQSKGGASRQNEEESRRARQEGPSHNRAARPRQRDANDLESDSGDDDDNKGREEDTSRALALRPESNENGIDATLTDEPADMNESRENRIRIVEPAKEKEVPRGILRKPTARFPEYEDNVREGVAPHKNSKKEGVPEGAKWTKISRQMVNPQALKEADERFEEREDFVIVLRAISREEIQKLADRTKEIRDEREHRHHRDHRRHRRRDYEDEDEDDDDYEK